MELRADSFLFPGHDFQILHIAGDIDHHLLKGGGEGLDLVAGPGRLKFFDKLFVLLRLPMIPVGELGDDLGQLLQRRGDAVLHIPKEQKGDGEQKVEGHAHHHIDILPHIPAALLMGRQGQPGGGSD